MRGEYMVHISASQSASGSSPHAWGIHMQCHYSLGDARFIPTCVGNTGQGGNGSQQWAVHPHMRGEYGQHELWHSKARGSSPHAWGIRAGHAPGRCPLRFIPTCVGNTRIWPWWWWHRPVHPHVRGEYALPGDGNNSATGSSPRAWGIPPPAWPRDWPFRFIPTCVGNTDARCSATCSISVHPHVRGEYCAKSCCAARRSGSSPRAWGILVSPGVEKAVPRFIPTCVGNT